MSGKRVDYEGGKRLTTVFQPHEERLYVQQDSAEHEAAIAQANAKARAIEQSGKGSVRMMLSMSPQEYQEICQKHPDFLTGLPERRRALVAQIAKERPELVVVPFKPRLHSGVGTIKKGPT